MCAKLRRVYENVMAESANLLVYFGDELGQKLLSQASSSSSLVKGSCSAASNAGN